MRTEQSTLLILLAHTFQGIMRHRSAARAAMPLLPELLCVGNIHVASRGFRLHARQVKHLLQYDEPVADTLIVNTVSLLFTL